MREDCPRHKGIMVNYSNPCICEEKTEKEKRQEELYMMTKQELTEMIIDYEEVIESLQSSLELKEINSLK